MLRRGRNKNRISYYFYIDFFLEITRIFKINRQKIYLQYTENYRSYINKAWPKRTNRTAKKTDLCIPRNETAKPRSQFSHLCICERDLYNPRIGPPFWKYLFRIFGTACVDWTVATLLRTSSGVDSQEV